MNQSKHAGLIGLIAVLCLVCSLPTRVEYGTLVVGIHLDAVSIYSPDTTAVRTSRLEIQRGAAPARMPLKKKTDSDSVNLSKIRFILQPGDQVFEFNALQATYTFQAELGIYNLTVEAINDAGKTVFKAFYNEILIEPNKTREIQLTLNPNFPAAAPEFIDLQPVNVNNSGSYTLRWNSVPEGETYTVNEDDESTFVSPDVPYLGPDTVFTISGKEDGKYYYRVKAHNSIGMSPWSASVVFQVIRASALALKTDSLPGCNEGSIYTDSLQAEGGTSPYHWTVTEGSLPPGLSINASTGVIGGAPTVAGTFSFMVQVTDDGSPKQSITKQFSIVVSAVTPTLSITTTSLASGQNGTFYSQSVNAAGGTTPYAWSVSSGSLPDGLTINASTGVISGMPTVAGTFGFTVRAADAGSPQQSDTQNLSITISPATLTITTTSLANGQVGQAYNQSVSAAGGTTPYAWSVSSGSLPDGLTISSTTGAISGTPTSAGTFNFTVQAADAGSQTDTRNLSITINPATLTITTTSLANGQVGQAYNQSVSAAGGTTPYAWSVSSGSLPDGLTINSTTGAISGTPTSAGTFNFTVQAADAGSPQQSDTQNLSITISPATLTITTTSMASGQVGTSYSHSVNTTGGTIPYAWSVSVGSLPDGLTINASTGVIGGMPTAAGTFDFTVQATDSGSPQQSDTQNLSITINPATLTIATTSLASGQVGQAYNQPVSATGGTTPYAWSVISGSLPNGLNLNSSTGAITGMPTLAGTFNFTVRAADAGSQTDSRSLSITISPATLTITTSSLPDITAGSAYGKQINASGGTPPYAWSETDRNPTGFAEGITFNGSGLLSGTTYVLPASGQITVRVTDSGASPQTTVRTFNWNVLPGDLDLLSAYLPDGEVDETYWGTIDYRLGTSPLQSPWTITGDLPPNLTVGYEASNYQMTLSGTPSAAGTYNFSVTVYDSGSPKKSRTDSFSITINP